MDGELTVLVGSQPFMSGSEVPHHELQERHSDGLDGTVLTDAS